MRYTHIEYIGNDITMRLNMRFTILGGKNSIGIIFRKFKIISALRLHKVNAIFKTMMLEEAEAIMQDTPDTKLFNISTTITLDCLCPRSERKADMKAPIK
jgi:hypothetical protein